MIWVFACFVLLSESWILAGHTYLREPKLCYDLLELLSMFHLNPFDLWNCSSASLISFRARRALLFLKICAHASLRFILELVIFLEILSCFTSIILREEKFYAHVLHLDLFELSEATYEISPKVIDIQDGYHKKFLGDHWSK